MDTCNSVIQSLIPRLRSKLAWHNSRYNCANTVLMSKKLIKFLVHFSDFIYNVIACFYAEICTIYQIYILKKCKT